jgi:hypothetical protein
MEKRRSVGAMVTGIIFIGLGTQALVIGAIVGAPTGFQSGGPAAAAFMVPGGIFAFTGIILTAAGAPKMPVAAKQPAMWTIAPTFGPRWAGVVGTF